MPRRFITGALIGAAVSMLFAPELDRSTRRRIKKTTRRVRGAAEEIYDNVKKGW
ncbi:YtxH domain-containing protein [Clostridium sp. DJ247]|uniref:YtxH domain-containing protein n=1 Tax=Clostridium sp. DJ247 TaxID=2726188 RepID=UPI00162804A3|nr:YtxH domain-containing protein [Clostridium sp. DJ247]MBC2580204.1 YtxH domain-containing protein [Clostridium sp. DJ247]